MRKTIRCFFTGHKIEKDRCIRCGKTLCEIKGHEWFYSGEKVYRYYDGSGYYTKPPHRTCGICEQEEHSMTNDIRDYGYGYGWQRVK